MWMRTRTSHGDRRSRSAMVEGPRVATADLLRRSPLHRSGAGLVRARDTRDSSVLDRPAARGVYVRARRYPEPCHEAQARHWFADDDQRGRRGNPRLRRRGGGASVPVLDRRGTGRQGDGPGPGRTAGTVEIGTADRDGAARRYDGRGRSEGSRGWRADARAPRRADRHGRHHSVWALQP